MADFGIVIFLHPSNAGERKNVRSAECRVGFWWLGGVSDGVLGARRSGGWGSRGSAGWRVGFSGLGGVAGGVLGARPGVDCRVGLPGPGNLRMAAGSGSPARPWPAAHRAAASVPSVVGDDPSAGRRRRRRSQRGTVSIAGDPARPEVGPQSLPLPRRRVCRPSLHARSAGRWCGTLVSNQGLFM